MTQKTRVLTKKATPQQHRFQASVPVEYDSTSMQMQLDQTDKNSMIQRKLVVLGNEKVGKTSLIKRYVYGEEDVSTSSTIGAERYKRVVETSDFSCSLHIQLSIWDTTG